MDTFVEQIIRKKKEPLEWLIIFGSAFAALVVSFAIFKFISMLVPMIVLVVWGAWWIITNQNKEFEYSITNGELDIDCIIAQRRRKRLCSVTCSKVESYGVYRPEKLVGRKFDHTVMAAPALHMEGNFYFIYRSKKYGTTLVVFHPDERVQKAFYTALPRLMQMQVDKDGQ
jgi:hypothetical protein